MKSTPAFNYFRHSLFMRKILLLPFSVLFAFAVGIRNFFFDQKINRSIEFDIPIIGVGNLAIGGQGKTPLTEYILVLVKNTFKTGVLSRGYKRKTKGFKQVELNSTAEECGDEPMQMKNKYKEVFHCVCEDRAIGIPLMLAENPLDVILLDDAFQHRWVKPGLNILLSDFNAPFFNDSILPGGNLRETRNGYRRADVIIFTKCISYPEESIRKNYLNTISKIDGSKVFFSGLEYGNLIHFFSPEKKQKQVSDFKNILLVCGIAKPKYISDYLKEQGIKLHSLLFNDHHEFTDNDLKNIVSTFEKLNDENAIIITTEKDAMRLLKFKEKSSLLQDRLFTLPIKIKFQPEEKNRFDKIIFDFIEAKSPHNN